MGRPDPENSSMDIHLGTLVHARTASGTTVPMRALRGPQKGVDFPVVWVCTESEYERALAEQDEPDGLPWPLDAIKVPELA